jgi:hypothetical protein
MCTCVTYTHSLSHIRVFLCVSLVDDSLHCKAAAPLLCAVCTWQSLEQRWRPCIERTRVASAAPYRCRRNASYARGDLLSNILAFASAPLTNFEKKHNNGPKDTTTSSVFRASYWPGAVTRSRKGREGRGRTGGIVQVLRPAHRVAARGSSHCCQSASRAAPHLLLLHTNVRPSRSRRPPAVESFCALHPPGSASEQRTRWAVCRAVYSTKRATTSSRS